MSNIYDADPAKGGATVTTSDTAVLDARTRALWVGGAGDVKVTTWDDSVLTFKGCAAGAPVPVKAKIVWSTGTTATDILALW